MEYKTRSAWGITNTEPLTSVFQNNHCEFLGDELSNAISARDWNHTQERKETLRSAITKLKEIDCENTIYELEKLIEKHCDCEINFDADTWYIGFKETEDGKLDVDPKAEYSAIVGEVYVQVVRSKWGVKGNYCSPCYPCQVDPNSEGDWIGFSLPPEIIGETDPDVRKKIFKLE